MSFGQDIEAVKKNFILAQNSYDTLCFDYAKEIIQSYQFSNPDSSIKYCDEAIEFAENINNISKKAEFISFKSDMYVVKMSYYNAIDLYFSSLKLISDKNNTKLYAEILLKLSKTLEKVDFNSNYAKNYLFKSQSVFTNIDDTIGRVKNKFVLSDIYAKEANYDSAFVVINDALTLCNLLNDDYLKAETFYHFSKIYVYEKEYLKATTYLKKSISLSKIDNKNAKYLNHLADIYVKMGFYKSAENIYNSANLDFNDQDNNIALIDNYLDLAKVSMNQNQNDKAIKYCQDALRLSKSLNMLLFEQEAYYQLSLIYSKNQYIELALYSYKKYSELRDSLFYAKTNNEAELLYANYINQLELKDQELLFRQKEYQVIKNEQQKLIISILIAVGVLLIIIIFILYRMYFLKRNDEQRLKLITEATLEGLIIHDGDIILEINDKYCEITGFQRNEVVGKNLFEFYSRKSQEEILRRMDMKRTSFYQLEVIKKDGTVINTEVLSKPMIFRGVKAKIVSIRDLSEISKIKEELHTTTKKFEALIETSPDGIVLTEFDGTITYVSPAFVELFGNKEAEDFLNKKLFDFVTPLYRNKIRIDIKNILYGDYCGVTEYVAENDLGDEIHIECNGDVLKDITGKATGIFMIVRDITERKISENALIESESRFRGLFNGAKDAIIIQNTNLQIVDANPMTSELFRYPYEQLIVMNFRELLLPEDRRINLEEYVDKPELLEIFAYTKNRKKIYVQISVSKLIFDKDSYYLLTIRDMTVFKHQEENLRRIASKLQASNATKDKMFSIISHDLRGPIGNLKTMIEFIAENPSEFDAFELVETISSLQESSSQTYELLENLLSWAKSQQNLLEYRPSILNLSEILLPSINFAREIAKSKNISVTAELIDTIEIIGDENMIKAVVRNLFSNAIKFSHKNGIILLNVEENSSDVVIKIADNGVGISEENLPKIFDESSYFSTYGTAKEKGSGLGLKLCSDFVKKNNGKIWVESEQNKGTSFYFTLKKVK